LSLVCPKVRLPKVSSDANAAELALKTVNARSKFLNPFMVELLVSYLFVGYGARLLTPP
jgi:hypothetical protein